jgi:type 1 glutamine amidotransferase
MQRVRGIVILLAALAVTTNLDAGQPNLKALIIDGQNNHGIWPKTSKMMKKYLEQTGLFTVDIATTAPNGTDANFAPQFSKYNVVVSNYNGAAWPKETQQAFVSFIKNGGGFVVVHAANNSFGDWPEYNEIIGLGGWGGRNEKSGPYVFFDEKKGEVVQDTSKGGGGHHGPQHAFSVVVRDREHPVTKGMPAEWMHAQDEMYDLLRGPAQNMQVLATAYAAPDKGGSGRHEPMIFSVKYGKGRVLHTPMGHADYSQECVGFIATLQRGAEWAATGAVTQKLPADFPTAEKVSQRLFKELAVAQPPK